MAHLHSAKQAYVAIGDHRDADGAFKAGDIVIVDEPALVGVLVREGSIDPSIVVDASMFTPGAPARVAVPTAPPAEPPADDASPADDETTSPAATGHRPSSHRMQTAGRAKARRS